METQSIVDTDQYVNLDGYRKLTEAILSADILCYSELTSRRYETYKSSAKSKHCQIMGMRNDMGCQ